MSRPAPTVHALVLKIFLAKVLNKLGTVEKKMKNIEGRVNP